MLHCNTCGLDKPESDFSSNIRCKICTNKAKAESAKRKREKVRIERDEAKAMIKEYECDDCSEIKPKEQFAHTERIKRCLDCEEKIKQIYNKKIVQERNKEAKEYNKTHNDTKKCERCKKIDNASEFLKSTGGYSDRCKECRDYSNKKELSNPPEIRNEKARIQYQQQKQRLEELNEN